MADNISDDGRLDASAAGGEGSADPSETGRMDRRSFLRALSGSALTVVAGGLTVTLAACQGASTTNPVISSVSVPNTPVALPSAPSASGISYAPLGGSQSSSSIIRGGSGSVISSGSGSLTSGVSGVSGFIAWLPRRDFGVDGWSTLV